MNHFIGNFVLMTLHAASTFISRINSNNALGLQYRQRLPAMFYISTLSSDFPLHVLTQSSHYPPLPCYLVVWV